MCSLPNCIQHVRTPDMIEVAGDRSQRGGLLAALGLNLDVDVHQ